MTKSEKRRGQRKNVAPAAATGGKGTSFENRVQAHRLLSMCAGSTSCVGVPEGFRIVELSFQARVHGSNTDDLVCVVEDGYGARGRVRMQMKRTLTASSSDTAFVEAVGLAWLDFESPTFRPGTDSFVVVYDICSSASMQGAAELARDARSSTSAENWHTKATAEKFSNKKRRTALAAVQSAVDLYNKAPVSVEKLHRFLSHVEFLHQDLDADDTAEARLHQQFISISTQLSGRGALPAEMVWAKLIAVCAALNGCAGEVNLTNVAMHIGADLHFRFAAYREGRNIGLGPQATLVAAAPAPPDVAFAGALLAPTAASASAAAASDLIPQAKDASPNKYISHQLDRINALIKACKFADALTELSNMREDLEDQELDAHQQARWYLMRGACVWCVQDDEQKAADDFLKGADLYEDDDKLAAARIRGNLLKGDVSVALTSAAAARQRFPNSLPVWVSWANARMVNGEAISDADIPAEHAEMAPAYQLAAAGLRKSGDLDGALRVALIGLTKQDASFFTREAALRYALELAAARPLDVAYRMGTPERLTALRRTVQEFTPREQRLWGAQTQEATTAAAMHLAYAHLLLGEPSQSLAIVDEGAQRGTNASGALIRPRIEALRDLDRAAEALVFGNPLLPTMPVDALVAFAQTAANEKDAASLDAAFDAGMRRLAEDKTGRLEETLQALRWEVMLRNGAAATVRDQVKQKAVLGSNSMPMLVMAARAFLQTNDRAQADAHIAQAIAVADSSGEQSDKYLLAQLLLRAQRHADAAARYESLLPKGALSELHTDLLFCYLRSGQRAKARALIQSFPADWKQDAAARHMALELGQQAGDWEFLESLVGPQLAAEPTKASSWLFKVMVTARRAPDSMDSLVAALPNVLEGSVREVTQLASAEFQHGQAEKGLSRLYRMRRINLGSTEAAAAHYTALAFAPEKLDPLHATPEVVGPGTSVNVGDQHGGRRWRTIDPTGFEDLPATEEFYKADSPEAKAVSGRHVGETFAVADGIGSEQVFTVEAIIPAHQRLAALSTETLMTTVAPSRHVTPVHLPDKEDGGVDFTPVLRQVERKAQRASETFRFYQEQSLTLGGLGRLLGTDVIDLVRSWPDDGSKLLVGGGAAAERQQATELLETQPPLLVDLAALTELALVGHLELLGTVKRVMVTSATRDLLEEKLAEHRIIRPLGVAFAHEGQLGIVETTEEARATETSFLMTILDAVNRHCEVVPAYGPQQVPAVLTELAKVVSQEEHAVLLAALEQRATLLALDARLRAIARALEVQGVWPQIFLASRVGAGLAHLDYSLAVLKMFFSRRDFVSLHAEDLLAMTDQGELWLNIGLNRLREYLTVPTLDFNAACNVVLQYLASLYRRGHCQFGVVLELYSYLLEGLLRHPSCPKDFAAVASDTLIGLLPEEIQEERQRSSVRLFASHARGRMSRPLKNISLQASVLYCSSPPTLRNGLRNNDDPLADASGQAASVVDKTGTSETTLNPTED